MFDYAARRWEGRKVTHVVRKVEMLDVVREVAPKLRSMGFKGSSKTYRRLDDAFLFVVNFQSSRTGEVLYLNLGAQPTFVPAEGDADLAKLKEYECILRRRVGQEWPPKMEAEALAQFEETLVSDFEKFARHVKRLPEAIAAKSPDALLDVYCDGTTRARSTLHLARAAAHLGHVDKARELAELGIGLAGERATILAIELKQVLLSIPEDY